MPNWKSDNFECSYPIMDLSKVAQEELRSIGGIGVYQEPVCERSHGKVPHHKQILSGTENLSAHPGNIKSCEGTSHKQLRGNVFRHKLRRAFPTSKLQSTFSRSGPTVVVVAEGIFTFPFCVPPKMQLQKLVAPWGMRIQPLSIWTSENERFGYQLPPSWPKPSPLFFARLSAGPSILLRSSDFFSHFGSHLVRGGRKTKQRRIHRVGCCPHPSMATIVRGSAASLIAAAAAGTSHGHEAGGGGIRRRPASVADTLVSRFHGVRLAAEAKAARSQSWRRIACKTDATAVVKTGVIQYSLPTWAEFEMGRSLVYWDTSNGRPPTSGQLLTIYFNPCASSELIPNLEHGIGFNGGFNQPIMCGGEPRVMRKKERGSLCEPIYAIKINVPLHALTLEFSFTDGTNWDGPSKLTMEVPEKLKGLTQRDFDEGLAKELAHEGACESAIYPEAVFVQDRCAFPAGIIQQGGHRCELDIVPGCTDPESPFFDPLANVDDGSCPYISDGEYKQPELPSLHSDQPVPW